MDRCLQCFSPAPRHAYVDPSVAYIDEQTPASFSIDLRGLTPIASAGTRTLVGPIHIHRDWSREVPSWAREAADVPSEIHAVAEKLGYNDPFRPGLQEVRVVVAAIRRCLDELQLVPRGGDGAEVEERLLYHEGLGAATDTVVGRDADGAALLELQGLTQARRGAWVRLKLLPSCSRALEQLLVSCVPSQPPDGA